MSNLRSDNPFVGRTSNGEFFEIRFLHGIHCVLVGRKLVFEGWLERCVDYVHAQGWEFSWTACDQAD